MSCLDLLLLGVRRFPPPGAAGALPEQERFLGPGFLTLSPPISIPGATSPASGCVPPGSRRRPASEVKDVEGEDKVKMMLAEGLPLLDHREVRGVAPGEDPRPGGRVSRLQLWEDIHFDVKH